MAENQKLEHRLKGPLIVILILGIIIGSISVLSSTIYLFKSPGYISGILFTVSTLVFIIGPLVYGIYYLVIEKNKEKQQPKIIEISQKKKN
jgi:uncharacterized membrane protein YciS (DUF1049 family)